MAKILIVDDSPADLKFMQTALQGTNHVVTAISDPLQVEAAAAAFLPDLMIVDVVMPGRNGYEVVRALRKQPGGAGVKVIFSSSKGNDTDVKWGLRQGADDYLIKPYTPAQLIETLARHVT
ncbi:response regulator [Deinococcus sp.]|uniref:response regulator n=1 Tax=Deinococcus sp. TaxID=47478 RepID=UPI0025DE52E5|nr:response regulator [Deinococcus sp.]